MAEASDSSRRVVVYVLFDLLWDNGRDLTCKTVVQRRERLQEIITPLDGVQVGGCLEQRGVELFQLAKEKGLEGIIAKRKKSTYQPSRRSPDRLKIKSRRHKSLLSAVSLKVKAVALRALERYCSLGIATASFGIWAFWKRIQRERIRGHDGAIEAAIYGQGAGMESPQDP
jgi:ATP dependent DNA ligase domain